MKITQTERGFDITEFTDLYGSKCSLQKSSLASQDAVWLGVDVHFKDGEVNHRMHLTRKKVADLLPYLKRFVKTGELTP